MAKRQKALSDKEVDSWPLKAEFLVFLNNCLFCVEKNDGFRKIVYFAWKKECKNQGKNRKFNLHLNLLNLPKCQS